MTDDIPDSETWPAGCKHTAFMEGVQWLEFGRKGTLLWPADKRDAEYEALRRYGEPAEPPRWLDAPDRPGLWYFKLADGFSDLTRIAAVPVPDTYLPCRWFGPIPEDT